MCTRVISAILDSWNLLIFTNHACSGSKKCPISVVSFRSITIFFNLKICIFVFNYNIFIYFVNREDIILLPFNCILTTTNRYVKTNKFHPPVINNDVMLKIKESIYIFNVDLKYSKKVCWKCCIYYIKVGT